MITPLISIIIPAYNVSKVILETLESVKQQTYTNWEIILVNDCSTDDTLEIATKFSNYNKNKFKIISNINNRGLTNTRNIAVSHASGEWLALLDSDDVWLPNHLETLMDEFAKDSELNMIYSGCLVFLDNVNNVIFKQEISEDMLNNFNVSLFTHQIGINPCTVLINKKVWQTVGGMDIQFTSCEDKDFFISSAKLGFKFKFSEQHTALYRKHSNGNAMSNNTIKMTFANIKIYEKHFDWDAIPLKIRINELSEVYLSYARLNRKNDIKTAVQYSLKALKIKKSLKNAGYYVAFSLISLIR